MNDLVSRALSLFSPKQAGTSATSHTLSLLPSSEDKHFILVRPEGWPKDTPPLYSLIISETPKPRILIFQGDPNPSNTIGDAQFHSLSSTTDLTLRGQHIRLKRSWITEDFSLESPHIGKWKWQVSKLTGSSMKLYDSSGCKMAELKSTGKSKRGEKELKISAPCNGFFVELVLLSVVTAKSVMKATDNAVLEGIQAITGA